MPAVSLQCIRTYSRLSAESFRCVGRCSNGGTQVNGECICRVGLSSSHLARQDEYHVCNKHEMENRNTRCFSTYPFNIPLEH